MDEAPAPHIYLLLFIIIIVIDFILSAFYTAIDEASPSKFDDVRDEKKKKRIEFFLDEPRRYLRTREFLYGALSVIFGGIIIRGFGDCVCSLINASGVSVTICYVTVGVLLLIILLWLGIFLPMKLASRNPVIWVNRLLGVSMFFYYIAFGFVALVDGLSYITGRIFGINFHEEEIISMVNEVHEQGDMDKEEADMIQNIFEFDDKNCEDIMTVRRNIIAIEANTSLEDAINFMLEENCSRFPVYEGDIDHINGMIHIKDAFEASQKQENLTREVNGIQGLVRNIRFVPETQGINTLFRTMQREKQHMVIVVDEYGQTSGIVAMEDILEEIVGNIEDEHDDEEQMIYRKAGTDHVFLINGMADLEDVEDALEFTSDFEDVDTMNGFLVALTDKIPDDNDHFEVTYKNYRFKVLSVSGKTISSVLATRISEQYIPKEIPEETLSD